MTATATAAPDDAWPHSRRADSPSCRLCDGALQRSVLRPRSSFGPPGRYRIDVCERCGAGTTMPRPTQAEIDACHAHAYDYGAHALIEREKRYRSTRLLRLAGVRRGRLLDVGCMFGFLLDEARSAGFETWGVEIARDPALAAAASGHRVAAGTLADHVAAHPEVRFDVIVAQHLLEHLPDPAEVLTTMAGLLVPGGRVILVVPNFDARLRRYAPHAWGWYQVPAHLHHFTPLALRRLAGAAGLDVESEHTAGGDSLFCALTAWQGIGLDASKRSAARAGRLTRYTLGVLGRLLRPYHALGDDELVLIARPG